MTKIVLYSIGYHILCEVQAMPVAASSQTTEFQNLGYHNNRMTLLWSKMVLSQNEFGTLHWAIEHN